MSFELISIVGPTASGKSDLAIEIALELGNAEIINTDSMQLYRGMDIGTAKLSQTEMRGVTHHLISVIDPTEEVSVVEYRNLFDAAFKDITSRGKLPISVGGSTLYLAAAIDEMDFAPTDNKVREKLERQSLELGGLAMWEELKRLDAEAAAKIPASNKRRVIRALEVIQITGQSWAAALPEPRYRRETLQLGISVPRAEILDRISKRVLSMWQSGIVGETAKLMQDFPNLSRTARVAIGYQQAMAQIAGTMSEADAIAETTKLTARYAKKQMTWFRRDKRIHWLDYQQALPQALEQIRLVR